MQSYNPAILECNFLLFFDYCFFYWDTQRGPLRRRERDYLMVAKYVNKKNAGKPRVLAINALLHSLAALTATFSAVAFYCYL